ncbi:MAG: hypothetical protein ABIF11_00290, partial [Nitrospirota bacterium]
MKRIILTLLLLLLTNTISFAQSFTGGSIGGIASLTNVPQVSGKTITLNTVYFGNWPLVIKNESNSYTPADNYIIKYDAATKSFGFEADAGAGGGDSITINGALNPIDTTADFVDTATITWALVDGGAGGPDQIQATAVGATGTDEDLDGTLENGSVSSRIMSIGGAYFTGSVTGPTVSTNTITTSWGYADRSIGTCGQVTGNIVTSNTVNIGRG